MDELRDTTKRWSTSPRRMLTDILFVAGATIGFYSSVAMSGTDWSRLVYFAGGVVCTLLLTPEFNEGRLKTGAGSFVAETKRRRPSTDSRPNNQPPAEQTNQDEEPEEYSPDRIE